MFFLATIIAITSLGAQAYATKLDIKENNEQHNSAIVSEKQNQQLTVG